MKTKYYQLYAQMPEHRRLVSQTKGFIKWALQQVQNPYVACSFGKDSSAMLHMVLEQMPNIPVVWVTFEETRLLSNYDEVVFWWKENHNINIFELFVESEIEEEIEDWKEMHKMGFLNAFVGIRSDEYKWRRFSLKKYGKFYDNGKYTRVAPLADWSLVDVAAYCTSNNLPMLDIYQNGFDARTTTGTPPASVRGRWLTSLKNTNISRFNQLLSKYPQLAKYC